LRNSNSDSFELQTLLKTSYDAFFVQSVDTFVLPLVKMLLWISTTPTSGTMPYLELGTGFFLLGLWCFASLLPSSPIDPLHKPFLKREKLLLHLAAEYVNAFVADAEEETLLSCKEVTFVDDVESQTALQLKQLKQLSGKHHGLTVSRVNQRFALAFSDLISDSNKRFCCVCRLRSFWDSLKKFRK
jgi:hypothetical protein